MADCTTAVVLAAGRGSRMRGDASAIPLAGAQATAAARGIKGMIPDDRGRPFLDHVLSSLADAGITAVCLVIGPDHEVIREHYAAQRPERVELSFVIQPEPTGTADGLLLTEAWTAARPFLVLNADNLYPLEAIRALVTLDGPGMIAFDRDALIRESNIEQERIRAFAIVSIRPDGTLAGIVEKPGTEYAGDGKWSFISMNIWRFDDRIFSACRAVPLSPRGEHELPQAVGLAIEHGMQLTAVSISSGVLDLSNRGDVAGIARQLALREIRP